jgi:hypothetical protein
MSNRSLDSWANAPKTAPKSFDDIKVLLEAEKSSMSPEDYNAILASIQNAPTIQTRVDNKAYLEFRIKAIQADIISAKSKQEAMRTAQATQTVQAPAVQAAAAGDTMAAAAVATVDIKIAEKTAEKSKAAAAIKAETPPKVAKLNTEVKADVVLRDIRAKFDEKLNFNDALAIVLANPKALEAFSQNDAYFSNGAKESPLTAFLDEQKYLAKTRFGNGENNYTTLELQAILELRDILKNNPEAATLLGHNAKIQRSVRIDESLKSEKPAQKMLAELLDFNNDGTLTTYNQKDRSSNVLIGGFQKMFDLWKDTQMVRAPELMAYQVFSSQVKSEEDVYALIGKRLGKTSEQVKADWADEKKKPLVIEQFRRVYLTEVAQSNTTVASKIDATQDIAKYQAEKAREQVLQLRRIKDKLASEGFVAKVTSELTGAWLPSLDGSSMSALLEQTALRVYEINPQLFASVGVNAAVNENILRTKTDTYNVHTTTTQTNTRNRETQTINTIIRDIRITQDASGNVVSREVTWQRPGGTEVRTVDRGTTSTTASSASQRTLTGSEIKEERSRETKLNPTLVIGLHQDVFGYKSEKFNAQAGVGASAVAGVDGIIFPITASVWGNFTASNSNASIQSSKLEGNFVLGARLSVSKALNGNNKDIIPSLGFDINPNDRLNAIEKQQVRLESLLEKITIKAEGTLDSSQLEKELAEKEADANKKDPKDINMLSEITLMRKFLTDTAQVLIKIPTDEAPDTIREQRLMMIKNNMQAYKSAYKEAILMNNQGYSIAGVNITFVPGISAVFLGLNIQNVVAKAKKTGMDAVEARLTGKPATLTEVNGLYKDAISLDPSDKTSLIVKFDAIQRGQIMLSGVQATDMSADEKKITPQEGFKLRFQKVEKVSGEGITIQGIVIDQIPVGAPVVTKVKQDLPAVPESGKKLEGVYNATEYTPKEREQLFILSRTHKELISALNSIISGKYSDAKAKIIMGGQSLSFIASKVGDGTPEHLKRAMDNLILATSGSRGVRDSSNLTYAQMIAEQRKNESAFMRLLPSDLTPGAKGVYKSIQAELNTGNKPTEKVELKPLSALVGAGYRDVSGTVSFSQIGSADSKGKRPTTLAGLFRFSGDMQVFGKSTEVGDMELQNMILEDAEKSGALKRNLDATNVLLKNAKIAEFTPDQYREYLMSGVLPESHKNLLDMQAKPKFLATRAALPGATCFNDVFAIAFPLVTIKGRQQEVTTTSLGDRSPTGSYVSTSEMYEQEGGGSSGTFGFNASRTITEQVTNAAAEVVTNSASNLVVNNVKETATTGTGYIDNTTVVRPWQGWSTTLPWSSAVDPIAPVTGIGSGNTF